MLVYVTGLQIITHLAVGHACVWSGTQLRCSGQVLDVVGLLRVTA